MVCGDCVQFIFRQSLPENLPVLLLPERRSHDRFQALLRILIKLLVQEQILGAGLSPDMRLPGGSCPPYFLQAFPGREMHDIDRCVPGSPGKIKESADRFRFRARWTAEGMPFCLCLPLPDELLPEKSHDPMVFTVRRDQDPLLGCALQDLHQIQVIQSVVIGHIDLEAGDPLISGNLRHVIKDAVIDMLQHPVKAVVHHSIPVRQPVIFLHLMPGTASPGTECHMIHYGRRPAAGCRHCAVVKIINDAGDPDVQVHMGVDVHCAGQDISAAGIDHLSSGRKPFLPVCVLRNVRDQAILQDNIFFGHLRVRHNDPAANYCFHISNPFHFR